MIGLLSGVGAGLKALSIGQKIAGVALTLAIWLAPAGAVWLYMRGQLAAQHALGVASCEAANADALARGWEQALEEWTAAQGRLDEKAKKDAAEIDSSLRSALGRAAKLKQEFSEYARENPLAPGCRADPGRVQRVQEARGQD